MTAQLPSSGPMPIARVRRVAAVLVDAGYLHSMVASALTGSPARGGARLLEYGLTAVAELQRAAMHEGLEVLRTYWYDGARDRIPEQQHRVLGRQPRVKLRLGSMKESGQQKGVDRLIQRDLLALAENKAVTDIVLITGDEDMEEEFDAAGQYGITMHLWGLTGFDDEHSQAASLIRAADQHRLFDVSWAARIAVAVEPRPRPAAVIEQPPHVAPVATIRAPTPADIARPRPTPPPASSDAEQPHGMSADDALLAWTSDSSGSCDRETHIDVGRRVFDVLAEQYGSRWAGVLEEIRHSGSADDPETLRLPVRIDAEVMDSAEQILRASLRGDPVRKAWIRAGVRERCMPQPAARIRG